MAIDRLPPGSALLAALRAEVTRKTGRQTRSDSAEEPAFELASTSRPRDTAELRRQLADIVKDLSPDDAEAMDAARPRVVRAVLLWEFGAELREHSEWQPMLDDLVGALEASEQHRQDFARLVRELKA